MEVFLRTLLAFWAFYNNYDGHGQHGPLQAYLDPPQDWDLRESPYEAPSGRSCYDTYVPHKGPATFNLKPADRTALSKRYFVLFQSAPPIPHNERPNRLWDCWTEAYHPYFTIIERLIPHNHMFSSFRTSHQKAVLRLQEIITENLESNNMDRGLKFLEFIKATRDNLNRQVYMHALAAATASPKHPMYTLPSPALPDIFPSRFFPRIYHPMQSPMGARSFYAADEKCLDMAKYVGKAYKDKETGRDENKLAYFREDIQLNMHHWSWHLRHSTQSADPILRRGELFYFFHHEFMSRYAAERLVEGFSDYFVDLILPHPNMRLKEGYDSLLRDGRSSYNWTARPDNTLYDCAHMPTDVLDKQNRTLCNVLEEHLSWWNHSINITDSGYIKTAFPGDSFLLPDGINTFGELFEASQYGINPYFYGRDGGWHNNCHDIIASVIINATGSEWSNGEHNVGVLGDVSTAVRDPTFYRIHRSVNEMFMRYKHKRMAPYELSTGDHPLALDGVQVGAIKIQSNGGMNETNPPNVLHTFYTNRRMSVYGGLDFDSQKVDNGSEQGSLDVCINYLDHRSFVYEIDIENQHTESAPRKVFVRIFMAPRYMPDGKTRFNATEQFKLFFTLDAFNTTLTPGRNTVRRWSMDSSVTAPWWKTKEDMWLGIGRTDKDDNFLSTQGHCGWPHHLLIPKGPESGDKDSATYDIIVMVTDGADWISKNRNIRTSYVHCGIQGEEEYPDRKPMGYPWDRKVNLKFMGGDGHAPVDGFVTSIPNMAMTQVDIVHDAPGDPNDKYYKD